MRVTARNATFQQWQALLENRTKRHRTRRFLVQGVRPIDEAVAAGWTVLEWLLVDRPDVSTWARDHAGSGAPTYRVDADLMTELGGKDDSPELLAVVEMPPDDLTRIGLHRQFVGVLFDRPSSPGNLGTVLRSLDAFSGGGLIVTGHASDPYDPRSVRASTGSLFRVPTVRADQSDVIEWLAAARAAHGLQVIGTDETGDATIDEIDLTGPVLTLTGNETRGLSRAWRETCDRLVRIPMSGHASSLNAASATSIVLYEAVRQRG